MNSVSSEFARGEVSRIEGRVSFEGMDEDYDISDLGPSRHLDSGSGESVILWAQGLLEDPIDERDYRAAEEEDHFDDLAFMERKRRSEENDEAIIDDLEDLDDQ